MRTNLAISTDQAPKLLVVLSRTLAAHTKLQTPLSAVWLKFEAREDLKAKHGDTAHRGGTSKAGGRAGKSGVLSMSCCWILNPCAALKLDSSYTCGSSARVTASELRRV